MTEHYDVMVSESYDWWTLMMAVPKTPAVQALLAPFRDARGYDDQGVEVEDYGRRLVIVVYCTFDYGGPAFQWGEDTLEELAELLTVIREETLEGNASFLQAVAAFYGADEAEEAEETETREEPVRQPSPDLTKAQLQQECRRRAIPFPASWTKAQLRGALAGSARAGPSAGKAAPSGKPPKLSKATQKMVATLSRV